MYLNNWHNGKTKNGEDPLMTQHPSLDPAGSKVTVGPGLTQGCSAGLRASVYGWFVQKVQ